MATSPETPPTEDLAADKARLQELGELIPAVNEDREALYEERLSIWKRLRSAGVEREEMARLAGTSVQMVKFALSADKKKAAAAG